MKDFLKGKGKRESEEVVASDSENENENTKKKLKEGEQENSEEDQQQHKTNEKDEPHNNEEGEEEGEDDDDDEPSSDYVSSNSDPDEEINVSFELKDPTKIDFHGIKHFVSLLVQGDNSEELVPSPLADLLIAQTNYVGSVIKIEENEEIFGLISVVNMHKYLALPTLQHLKKHLLSKANTSREQLETIFQDKSKLLGLLINDRMLNVPPQLSYPLHNTLFQEIQWAKEYEQENNDKENGDKKGKGKSTPLAESEWNFSHYLYITSYYVSSKKKKGQNDEITYSKVEDEFYHKRCYFQFSFPIIVHDQEERWTLSGDLSKRGLVLLIEHTEIENVLNDLKKLE